MAIATALLPSIAATNGNIKEKESRINRCFLLEMCIAIPVTLILVFYSNDILGVLFPNAKDGGNILKISAISIIFITIEQITNNILHAIGKTKVPVISIVLGVIAKAILNSILVTKTDFILGGVNGAAFATVVCHIIASMTSFIYLLKHTKLKITTKNCTKPLFASIVLIVISRTTYKSLEFIINAKLNLGISVMMGVLGYLIMLKSMKILKKSNTRHSKY